MYIYIFTTQGYTHAHRSFVDVAAIITDTDPAYIFDSIVGPNMIFLKWGTEFGISMVMMMVIMVLILMIKTVLVSSVITVKLTMISKSHQIDFTR